MGKCKEIIIKVIPASVANPFVKAHHYSGKVVPNSQLHFGAFLDGKLHGVLSYGCSMDKRKTMALVKDTGWNEFLELNRMAFDDYMPRNSESYCIGATLRMIRKQAPQIKWVISFADGTQCGDGTIYRASNFALTGIKQNNSLRRNPATGEVMQDMTAYHHGIIKEYKTWPKVEGFQLRYIYFLDKASRSKLTVPELPYSAIDEMGAGMYKGANVTREQRHTECEAQKERQKAKEKPQPTE